MRCARSPASALTGLRARGHKSTHAQMGIQGLPCAVLQKRGEASSLVCQEGRGDSARGGALMDRLWRIA